MHTDTLMNAGPVAISGCNSAKVPNKPSKKRKYFTLRRYSLSHIIIVVMNIYIHISKNVVSTVALYFHDLKFFLGRAVRGRVGKGKKTQPKINPPNPKQQIQYFAQNH